MPDQEPAPPPTKELVIEPQVDPLKAEKMFTQFVEQLVKRCVLRALSVLKQHTVGRGCKAGTLSTAV